MDEVLAVLRKLLQSITSPVIRACLEQAHKDIAYDPGPDVARTGTSKLLVDATCLWGKPL